MLLTYKQNIEQIEHTQYLPATRRTTWDTIHVVASVGEDFNLDSRLNRVGVEAVEVVVAGRSLDDEVFERLPLRTERGVVIRLVTDGPDEPETPEEDR